MKKMSIYEPAMCCSTGLCGVSVNPELLRISTVLNNLKKNGIVVERFNLSSAPQAFVNNKVINKLIQENGVELLPITVLDDQVVKTKAYLTNEEFAKFLEVTEAYLCMKVKKRK